MGFSGLKFSMAVTSTGQKVGDYWGWDVLAGMGHS